MIDAKLGVMLYVADLKESVEFYRDKLGFGFHGYWDNATNEVVEQWEDLQEPGYASVTVGEDDIGLHPHPDFEEGPANIKINFEIDDADALYEEFTSKGVEASEPQDFPWGARMFTVVDPNGHKIDFLEHLEQ